jgi:predicted amidohydrolase YtcJ
LIRYTNLVWGISGIPAEVLMDGDRIVEVAERVAAAEETIDFGGKVAIPGFVDAHCHILPTGLDLLKLSLEGCSSHEEVLERVKDHLPNLGPGKWLLGVLYDQTRFPDGQHLTADDLDKIASDRPVLLRHVNGHASVANSAALLASGVGIHEVDPDGGSFGRRPDGSVNGVLFEETHERVHASVPMPTFEEMVQAILRAGERMRELGIFAACDMMTGRFDLEQEVLAYLEAANQGCQISTRLYMQWKTVFGPKRLQPERLAELEKLASGPRCRVAGVKIFADGAIGSATAAIYGSYTGASADGPRLSNGGVKLSEKTSGQLIYAPEKLNAMVRTAHDAGYSVATHTIGDYATDLVMDAYESTGEASRHRIEHAMLLSDLQIERMAKLGCHCSVQPEFLMRFGHAYQRQLGPERAWNLKRVRSMLDAGIPMSFGSDRPIVPGNPLDGIATAVSRPDGFNPAEACSTQEALSMYTEKLGALMDDPDLKLGIQALPAI